MRVVLLIVLSAMLAVFGSRAIGRPIPLVGRFILPSRSVFLILGILLGPHALGLMTGQETRRLEPVLVVGLGWIGLLFGVNLDFRALRRLPRGVLSFTMGQALFTFLLVLSASLALLVTLWSEADILKETLPAAVAIAACASGTAQGPLFHLRKDRRFRGATARVVQMAGTLDDLPALAAVGILAGFLYVLKDGPGGAVLGLAGLPLQVAVGVVFGLILAGLTQGIRNQQVLLVILLGIASMSGGLAGILHMSPLVVNTAAGAVLVNVVRRERVVSAMLERAETTIYVLFLVLVGSQWRLNTMNLLPLTAVVLLARFAGKVGGGWLMWQSVGQGLGIDRRIGLAMLFQGGLAIALAVDFARLSSSAFADLILTVTMLSLFLNGFLGRPLALRIASRGEP